MNLLGNYIYMSEQIIKELRDISDPFSQELIKLWDDRKLTGKVFYMLDGLTCIGYILLDTSNRSRWTIRGFFVQGQYRGRGFGQKLLQSATYYCTNLHKDVYVNITKGAENIYRNEGYELLGPREDFPDQIKAVKKAYKTPTFIPHEKLL
jgi:GNAT superfamily N-acetyltransferase